MAKGTGMLYCRSPIVNKDLALLLWSKTHSVTSVFFNNWHTPRLGCLGMWIVTTWLCERVRISMTGATKTCGLINIDAMIYLIDKKLALIH